MQLKAVSTYVSPASSKARRAELASLLSPLRRVTPRVPFWQLAAHRVPTLWSLYRGMLKAAPTPEIRWRVTWHFKQNQHLTSPKETKIELLKGERLLDVCQLARRGDDRSKAILERYSRMIAAHIENIKWENSILEAKREMDRLRNRPIITGYFRPTPYNNALPRLKPQPAHITMMIAKRRRHREMRNVEYADVKELKNIIESEVLFERILASKVAPGNFEYPTMKEKPFTPTWWGHSRGWEDIIEEHRAWLKTTFAADNARLHSPFPPELLARIADALRRRAANKLRERHREERGEVLKRTIIRARKGMPAHVLSRASPERIKLDKIARSNVSEVGYVGHVKKVLGWKLKRDNPWVEDGPEEMREKLQAMEREVNEENRKRRAEWARLARSEKAESKAESVRNDESS
ncbi:hypothetical protein BDW22DRAFT_663212 [Trametopsis cervina]|nr:hypothetical protein BDW22DRAFT_663212 [Trametopsis cervina]